jgi:flavin-dependent dehydrogenase
MTGRIGIPERVDVAVVGGRIAGSSVAARLAAAGLSVAVFDREGPQRPTLSTHILHSTDDVRIEGLFDGLVAAGVPPLLEVRVRVDDVAVPLRHRDDPGMCPRREILDQLLVDRATAAGARVFTGVAVLDVLATGPGVGGSPRGQVHGVVVQNGTGAPTEVRAELVVGADGRNSSVARWVGAREYLVSRSERSLLWRYFRGKSLPPALHWHRVGEHIVSVLPTGPEEFLLITQPPDRSQIRLSRTDPAAFLRHVTGLSPDIGDLVEGGEAVGRLGCMVRYPCYFRQPYGPGWVLVGDAGHAKDATIGHGINDALRNARALAEIVCRHWSDRNEMTAALEHWAAARDRTELANYWYGQDLGRGTAVSAVEREILLGIRRHPAALRALDDVMADRLPADRLLTGARLAAAAARRIGQGAGVRSVAGEVAQLVGLDWRRRRAADRRLREAPGRRSAAEPTGRPAGRGTRAEG